MFCPVSQVRTSFLVLFIMKDLTLFLLLAILGFLIWNQTSVTGETYQDVSASVPVKPATIQSIVNSIQAKNPDVYPVQTIYINSLEGSNGSKIYNARIMFLNTRGYFGVQYDVQADENGNIISMTESPTTANIGDPVFQPYRPTDAAYGTFEDIQSVLDKQFADLKTQVPGFTSKFDSWLDSVRQGQNITTVNNALSGTVS